MRVVFPCWNRCQFFAEFLFLREDPGTINGDLLVKRQGERIADRVEAESDLVNESGSGLQEPKHES